VCTEAVKWHINCLFETSFVGEVTPFCLQVPAGNTSLKYTLGPIILGVCPIALIGRSQIDWVLSAWEQISFNVSWVFSAIGCKKPPINGSCHLHAVSRENSSTKRATEAPISKEGMQGKTLMLLDESAGCMYV
jgi:hypothetical protein